MSIKVEFVPGTTFHPHAKYPNYVEARAPHYHYIIPKYFIILKGANPPNLVFRNEVTFRENQDSSVIFFETKNMNTAVQTIDLQRITDYVSGNIFWPDNFVILNSAQTKRFPFTIEFKPAVGLYKISAGRALRIRIDSEDADIPFGWVINLDVAGRKITIIKDVGFGYDPQIDKIVIRTKHKRFKLPAAGIISVKNADTGKLLWPSASTPTPGRGFRFLGSP